MGRRGPKPKPTALRVFEGNPGRKPVDGAEPAPPVADVSAPEWLGEIGRRYWDLVAAHLAGIKLLTTIDRNLLSLWATAWQEFHDANDVIAKEGMTAVSEKGAVYQHPAVGIRHKAMELIKKLSAEFGMSPAARVGLKIQASDKAQDDLAEFKKHG